VSQLIVVPWKVNFSGLSNWRVCGIFLLRTATSRVNIYSTMLIKSLFKLCGNSFAHWLAPIIDEREHDQRENSSTQAYNPFFCADQSYNK
jgi:hypothetical protein